MTGSSEWLGDGVVWDEPIGVEVRNRFDGGWALGFEIVSVVQTADGPAFRLRRLSDGWMLPSAFDAEDLRRSVDGRAPRSAG